MTEAVRLLLDDIRDESLAECLAQRGWLCTRINQFGWETPAQFNARHGRAKNWLARQMYHDRRPIPDFEKQLGKESGKLVRLRSNPELEAFASNGH